MMTFNLIGFFILLISLIGIVILIVFVIKRATKSGERLEQENKQLKRELDRFKK